MKRALHCSKGFVQRLFSTFARGWPGTGLLLQRCVAATLLFFSAIVPTAYPSAPLLQITAAAAGVLLLLGLWTPLAGMVVAVSQLALLALHRSEPALSLLLATLGATLAMIGPGAWSVDARLFGRKEVRM